MRKNNYLLKFHQFFINRVLLLIGKVKKLHRSLSFEEYKKHTLVKLLKRITDAYSEHIPQSPNLSDYYLKGSLSKFRRYKRGLQRNRMMFCFANNPPIIIYLYINDENHLRSDGSQRDPYKEFTALVKKGVFSSDSSDPAMQKWIKETIH